MLNMLRMFQQYLRGKSLGEIIPEKEGGTECLGYNSGSGGDSQRQEFCRCSSELGGREVGERYTVYSGAT